MAELAEGTSQYQPYRAGAATGRWDPTRNTQSTHANGHANGLPGATPGDESFLVTPSPPVPAAIRAGGRHSLAGVAARAFGLGLALGGSAAATATLLLHGSALWRLPFFVTVLALFHFLEFAVTARWNPGAATLDAFLLTANGSAYNVAHALAALETTVAHSAWRYPRAAAWEAPALRLGLVLLMMGQAARSVAMAQAGTNFNHTVQSHKRQGHELVTQGIYGVLRHPSYFGFFWWGLGSQLVLGNVVCLLAYAVVLWRFFNGRIRGMLGKKMCGRRG